MKLKTITEKVAENWPVKIVCVTLSLLFFLFYRMSTLEERFFSVPLVVETNGDLVPASPYPRMVKIRLRGENESIYPVLEEDVVAFIDLKALRKEGEYRVQLGTRLKGTALDVEPLEVGIDPVEISLRVEHKVSKKVPVTPGFKGYPESGYEFSGFTVSPANVEISGPRTAVEKIREIETGTVELTGVNASFGGTVPLVHNNPLVSVSGSVQVQYTVTITQTTMVRNFEAVPFYFENLDPSLAAVTDKVSGSLQISGAQTDLADWILPENALTVLCENVHGPGIYTLPVHAIVPDPFTVVQSDPPQVVVMVQRKAQ
jgi:YbbR domain-containing protein